ncbi:type II toxin-antitoxin system RelE/ParE family toxin [Delftia acidovorans]|uniref:type II toxin-antitoxin system RelE/ParE family toxin n=1 Tax=Delftia acidovorans TaxID=80866 RepID=UPI002FDE830E
MPHSKGHTAALRLRHACIEEAVYVLHCVQKKSQVTSRHDKDIASARYRAVVHMRKANK